MQLISLKKKCELLTSPNDITWWHLTNIMHYTLFFIKTVETQILSFRGYTIHLLMSTPICKSIVNKKEIDPKVAE